MKSYNREWYIKNSKEHKARMKEKRLNPLYKYGGTKEEYTNLLFLQSNRCAICNINTGKLVVDHCHLCGFFNLEAVRGLLCRGCNNHANFTLDNPDGLLIKAYKYAKVHIEEFHSSVV